ncbi:MAG: TRAM domain-containing protein [Acidobacteriota bacterium]
MTIRATVEKLAPTGEGIVRTREGVGLVEGALPGEDVDVEIVRVSSKIWRGRVSAVHSASPARISGGHAGGCPACDWAHFEPAAAAAAKRELFLETMSRIGRLPAEALGELPIEASPPGYRLRSRFHVSGRGADTAVGGYAPRTHHVESLAGCEALTPEMREELPRLVESIRSSGAAVTEIATLESLDASRRLARLRAAPEERPVTKLARALAARFEGVRIEDSAGRVLHRSGEPRLWLSVGGRELPATPDAFFQSNRFLIGALAGFVTASAAAIAPGQALDAFGGVGLFAGALLDAGHRVVSVESHATAAEEAKLARVRWREAKRWRIERASVLDFAASDSAREALVVVDPPRAGLGASLARALAARAESRLIYVSCDPATLARDLAWILPEGWRIAEARLFDLFALTHRVEAVVVLDRPAAA